MKNKQFQSLFCAFPVIVFSMLIVLSCNKKFDEPPVYIPPNISVTSSIQSLQSLHVAGQVDSITTDVVIGGVVIANDSSGNFYKQIIIEDSTGGIAVNIDDYNLYASFPIGRKIYVKLKGLYMADNGGLIYIGSTPDNSGAVSGIAGRLEDQYLVKGELNMPVAPAQVSIFDVKNNPAKYMYTLVQFNNFEVKESDTAKTYAYATATTKTNANIIIKGCSSSDTMIIRTSGYSSFANVNVPNGNGTVTAVYAYYKSPYNAKITPQLILRDTSDMQLTGTRCDGTSPSSGEPVFKKIKDIRAMYTGKNMLLGTFKIGGVVISDAANKNGSSGSFILQDGDHGISVYYGGTISYNTGDSVVLNITGDSLLNYKGSMEIKARNSAVPPAPIATNRTVVPVIVTLQQLNSALPDIEFTLVKIKNATASGAPTYGGNPTLTDSGGNVILYTSPNAIFASASLPSGAKDWVGYGSFFGATKQFQIRNADDVTEATNSTDTTAKSSANAAPDLLISEYVEGSSDNKYLEIYNAGSTAADLSKYMIKLYANGSVSASNQAVLDTLSGAAFLPAGGIIVLQNEAAALTLPAGVVAHHSSVCNFNGDDAIALEKEGVVIDVFGMIGVDPGSSWTIAGNRSGAVDHSERRNVSVIAGNPDWASSSATGWIMSGKDDVSNLGTR